MAAAAAAAVDPTPASQRALVVKDKPQYSNPRPGFNGGPRNGHWGAELDPGFATAKSAVDGAIASIWATGSWEAFRRAWLTPVPVPDDCPQPGRDVEQSLRAVPVRDGAEVEIQISKKVGDPTPPGGKVLVLRTHGGGWATGGHATEMVENLKTVGVGGLVLVSVDYRLAPEYPFPYAVNDAFDVLKWCKAHASELDVNPEKIILLGGSAGANMSIVLSLMAREEGVTGIIGQVLDYPTSCHPKFFPKDKYELESYDQHYDASVVNSLLMETFLDAYDPDPKPDWRHSPLLVDSCKGLPPAFVQVAGADPLRDEGIAWAERLEADGVPVELHVYKGLPHFFSAVVATLPQTKLFLDRQAAWIKKTIASSS